jgi:hypothetical protein
MSPRTVIKTVVLFIAAYGCGAWDKRRESLAASLLKQLCCSKQEAGNGKVPTKHGVDLCLLTKKHLESGMALRFASRGYLRTFRPTSEGCTATVIRRGIDPCAVPV